MRIGVDVDGCIRDIHEKLVQVYNREMKGLHWCDPPEKWRTYCIKDHFSINGGIYDFWFRVYAEEIYLKSLPFSDLYVVRNLISCGHEVIVLTDQPNPKTEAYTLEWINQHIPVKEIHFTSEKQLVYCDVYLEDSPEHIEKLLSHGREVVIRDHGWNRDIKMFDGQKRVKSLTEFAELIHKGDL